MAQRRTKQAQFADAAFPAETRNLLPANLDGQLGTTRATIVAKTSGSGTC